MQIVDDNSHTIKAINTTPTNDFIFNHFYICRYVKVYTHVLMDEQSKLADKFLISKRCVSAEDALKGFDISAPDLSKLSYLE